jgi:PEP-CTERM motif
MNFRLRFLPYLIAACACPLGASAEIVTFNFVGSVSYVYNPYAVVDPLLIRIGDPVQASLRYDTTTPDTYPESDRGSFIGPGWLKVTINGLTFERTTTVQIDILHGANGGQELFQAMALNGLTSWPNSIPSYPFQNLLLQFWETGPPHDFLSNADLPTSLDFSRADVRLGTITTSTSSANMYEVQFNLTQVPEPATATLLIVGLLAAGILFRSTRNCSVSRVHSIITAG